LELENSGEKEEYHRIQRRPALQRRQVLGEGRATAGRRRGAVPGRGKAKAGRRRGGVPTEAAGD
jgi:hypothetical protein